MEYLVQVEQDVNIYIEDINPKSDKVILFLHGWPANHKMFEYQYEPLANLGYRCIGMDTRGFGQSDKPLSGYHYDRLADDVFGVINALKLDNITLTGHSMGGAIAIRYMARHMQEHVSKLALFGAAAPSLTQQPNFPYGLPASEVSKLIDETHQNRPQMLDDFRKIFFHQPTTEAFNTWFFLLGISAASWATVQCAVTFRDETLFTDLSRISVPTLILHGVHDQVCKFQLALALKQGIKNAKLVPFENSGHGLFWDEHEKFNRELAAFLGS